MYNRIRIGLFAENISRIIVFVYIGCVSCFIANTDKLSYIVIYVSYLFSVFVGDALNITVIVVVIGIVVRFRTVYGYNIIAYQPVRLLCYRSGCIIEFAVRKAYPTP